MIPLFVLVKDTLQNQILHLFSSLKIDGTCSFIQGLSHYSTSYLEGLPSLQRWLPVEGRAVDTDRPTASSAVLLVPAKITIILLDFIVFR